MWDTYTNLRLAADRVQIKEEEHRIKGNVLVRAPRYPAYMYGDEPEAQAELQHPPVFEGFSCRDYLARHGTYGMVAWPKIRLPSRGGRSPITRALFPTKTRVQAAIARILPQPEASLLMGILSGIETRYPEAVKDAFSTTGTSYAIAISGLDYKQTT